MPTINSVKSIDTVNMISSPSTVAFVALLFCIGVNCLLTKDDQGTLTAQDYSNALRAVKQMANSTLKPCKNFVENVCSRYNYSQSTFIWKQFSPKIFANLLGSPKFQSNKQFAKVKKMYDSCMKMASSKIGTSSLIPLKKMLEELDLISVLKMEKATDWKQIAMNIKKNGYGQFGLFSFDVHSSADDKKKFKYMKVKPIAAYTETMRNIAWDLHEFTSKPKNQSLIEIVFAYMDIQPKTQANQGIIAKLMQMHYMNKTFGYADASTLMSIVLDFMGLKNSEILQVKNIVHKMNHAVNKVKESGIKNYWSSDDLKKEIGFDMAAYATAISKKQISSSDKIFYFDMDYVTKYWSTLLSFNQEELNIYVAWNFIQESLFFYGKPYKLKLGLIELSTTYNYLSCINSIQYPFTDVLIKAHIQNNSKSYKLLTDQLSAAKAHILKESQYLFAKYRQTDQDALLEKISNVTIEVLHNGDFGTALKLVDDINISSDFFKNYHAVNEKLLEAQFEYFESDEFSLKPWISYEKAFERPENVYYHEFNTIVIDNTAFVRYMNILPVMVQVRAIKLLWFVCAQALEFRGLKRNGNGLINKTNWISSDFYDDVDKIGNDLFNTASKEEYKSLMSYFEIKKDAVQELGLEKILFQFIEKAYYHYFHFDPQELKSMEITKEKLLLFLYAEDKCVNKNFNIFTTVPNLIVRNSSEFANSYQCN